MNDRLIMTYYRLCLVITTLLLATGHALAQPADPHYTDTPAQQVLDVYVRDGCPHCSAAKQYLDTLQRQHPGLVIRYWPIDTDRDAYTRWRTLSEAAALHPPGVPLFASGNRVLLGFVSPAYSGPLLMQLIAADRPATDPTASRPKTLPDTLPETLSVATLGLPLFTLAIGLLDGFNPCATWVLLFLLSMLVHLRDRRRMALIAGTFVLVSGALYYAFMAAWLNLFLLTGMSLTVRLVLALIAILIGLLSLKDFLTGFNGVSLSIPASAKPGLYARMRHIVHARSLWVALSSAAVLAALVNVIELLCTAGLPAMYTAILSQQALSEAAWYGYLGLYILGYIADDSLMVGLAVWALSSQKLTERAGRWLKLISGSVMLLLGIMLMACPDCLF